MKNQVIKNVNEETAKQIKKYWEDRGVDTKSLMFSGMESRKNIHFYYGFINDKFGVYSLNSVQKANAEIIELNEYPKMMLVWDDDEHYAQEKYVIFEGYGFYWVAPFDSSIEEISINTYLRPYKHAKDIEEPKELVLTMEEATEIIAKEKGTTSNLIRIKK